MITSLNNETVKKLIKLKTSKGREEFKQILVETPNLISEAQKANLLIKVYTIDESIEGELVSVPVMEKICNTKSISKVIGVAKLNNKHEIKDRVLILDEIQDPGNLGALMRSAYAFGFETIFLSDNTCDIYNDKAVRSSEGAIFKLNFVYGDKIEFINKLKETHHIYGTNVVNGIDINQIKKEPKMALILGNEGHGISKEINDLKLDNLYIKLNNTESLNVSVAGSIIMYEMNK